MEQRKSIRITRAHYTDLVCAAMNDTTGDTQRILDRMEADPGFQIDEQPVEGVFYIDQSVNFMYPHEIGLIEAVLPPDVVYPRGLPGPVFYDPRDHIHHIDELSYNEKHGIPVVAFDVERTVDGKKLEDIAAKLNLGGTYGRLGRPSSLYPIQAREPDPAQPEIDPNPKRKPPPSGLLMRLMSRL